MSKSESHRILVATLVVVSLFVAVVVQLIRIQFVEGQELRAKAEKLTIRYKETPAARGNIYASDGALLATTMPKYKIYMDVATVSEELFQNEVNGLAQGLARVLRERSTSSYESYLKANRKHRYLRIAKSVSYAQLLELKQLPVFNRGKFKGGLIIEQENKRQMPLGRIAERTIGYHRNGIKVGLEGSYSPELSGRSGQTLSQKIARGEWKPIHDKNNTDPEDGYDLLTTIDVSMQDVAHTALLRALEKHQADHGSVIVMEVETGAIKAMVNLGVTHGQKYYEKYNYGIGESTEPGSTFKLAALVVGLEDGKLDTAQMVDTKQGSYQFYQHKMLDSRRGGYGRISLGRAFELSSNIGLARAINEAYADQPERFINRLYKMNVMEPTGIELLGEPKPHVPSPSDGTWSGISLPWMATGYGVQQTPLQSLSFYNAIANNGKMMRPFVVKELQREGKAIKEIEPSVINPKICSQEVLLQVQDLLEKVVERGTATNIKSSQLSMAGKTGTCVLNYWKSGESKEYQASFAGYFPAKAPKYSCIVVVHKPKRSTGYYGADVAGPVFKEIALNLMAMEAQSIEQLNVLVDNHGSSSASAKELQVLSKVVPVQTKSFNTEQEALSLVSYKDTLVELQALVGQEAVLPNLKGMTAMDAVYFLENLGIRVSLKGNGKVKDQSVRKGTPINQINAITLYLDA